MNSKSNSDLSGFGRKFQISAKFLPKLTPVSFCSGVNPSNSHYHDQKTTKDWKLNLGIVTLILKASEEKI
jgi:hypothetical protein